MNRIDRLFSITTRLRANSRVRAQDLAAIYEVSIRTIYRDIAALSESGIPIVSLPGQGYALADGFFLPPLVLSTSEGTALILGARLLADQASDELARAADEAAAKIVSVMDASARKHFAEMDEVLDLVASPVGQARLDLSDARIRTIWRAILERRVLALRYFGRNRSQETFRQVEPLRLQFTAGAWYLTAFCRLRQEQRDFRLDRIQDLQVASDRFRRRSASEGEAPSATEVIVRFRREAARWVQERQHWSFFADEQTDDGLVVHYRLQNSDEIASWLLGWGTQVEVLSPPQLRERVRDEARGVIELLT